MKKFHKMFRLLLALLFGASLGIAEVGLRKSVGGGAGELTEGFTVPTGATVTLVGNLSANGATVSPTEVGRIDGITAYGQSLISGADAAAVRTTLEAAPLTSASIGIASPDAGASTGSAESIRVNRGMSAAARGVVTATTFYASEAGAIEVLVLSQEGTGTRWTVKRSQALTASVGLQTHALSLLVDRGDVLGVWNNVGRLAQDTEAGFTDLYSVTGVTVSPTGTINLATGPSALGTQINFTLAYFAPAPSQPSIEIVASSSSSILFYVPSSESAGARWEFIRTNTETNPSNLDKWHLSRVFPVYRLGEYTYVPRIGGTSVTVFGSTWEHAVQISGDGDFSGGIAHGWQRATSTTFLIDGEAWTPTPASIRCSSAKVLQESDLFRWKSDPEASEDLIANVSETFTFSPLVGLDLRQSLRFAASLTVQMAYMGMWPLERAEGVYTISSSESRSNSAAVRDISASGHTILYTLGTTSATLWDSANGLRFDWAQLLSSGSEQLFFVSNSVTYNKVYRQACDTGASVTSSTIWDTFHRFSIAP